MSPAVRYRSISCRRSISSTGKSNLKADRKNAFESVIQGMLDEVLKLRTLLTEIEEPLEEFDEKLFYEIVKDVVIAPNDEMTITVLGGLKFTELI